MRSERSLYQHEVTLQPNGEVLWARKYGHRFYVRRIAGGPALARGQRFTLDQRGRNPIDTWEIVSVTHGTRITTRFQARPIITPPDPEPETPASPRYAIVKNDQVTGHFPWIRVNDGGVLVAGNTRDRVDLALAPGQWDCVYLEEPEDYAPLLDRPLTPNPRETDNG